MQLGGVVLLDLLVEAVWPPALGKEADADRPAKVVQLQPDGPMGRGGDRGDRGMS